MACVCSRYNALSDRAIFREEGTSALAGFLEMLIFCGGRKAGESGEKLSEQGEKKQQQTRPTCTVAPGRNRTQATLVRGERFHHCAVPIQ